MPDRFGSPIWERNYGTWLADTEPYVTLLNGIIDRLLDASGPFVQDDQVKIWAHIALDEVAPSDELQAELSRSVPIALVTDGGGRPEFEHGDGTDERHTIKIWFCSSAPTTPEAVTGDGTNYWGSGRLQHWILARLLDRDDWDVVGWEHPTWVGTEPVAVPDPGRVMMVATFESLRLQTG